MDNGPGPEYKPATVQLLLLITLTHATLYCAQEIVEQIKANRHIKCKSKHFCDFFLLVKLVLHTEVG
jgi:hypothetical protein